METNILDQKRTSQTGKTISRFETQLLDWKHNFQFGKKILRLGTICFDQKQGFSIPKKDFQTELQLIVENGIFRWEALFLD